MRKLSQRLKKHFRKSYWRRYTRVACWDSDSEKIKFGILKELDFDGDNCPFGVLLDGSNRVCFFENASDLKHMFK